MSIMTDFIAIKRATGIHYTWMDLTEKCRAEEDSYEENISYESIYTSFKNRQNKSVLIK